MSRLNFAEFSKHCLETVVVGAVRQALDKEVKESTVLTLTLFTSLMGQHLNLFAIELEGSGLCDGVIGGLLALKLDVSKTSGLTVRIELKLARANRSEGRERIKELLLCDGEVNIANKYISFGLHEVEHSFLMGLGWTGFDWRMLSLLSQERPPHLQLNCHGR